MLNPDTAAADLTKHMQLSVRSRVIPYLQHKDAVVGNGNTDVGAKTRPANPSAHR